jgi:uncharacterized phage protein (predicted DNA packaging)
MFELQLEELKEYLRIDGSEEDTTLALFVAAAEEYLAEAGVPEDKHGTARYKLAVMLYCSINYEHRDPSEKIEKFNFSLESLILQLKTG